MGKAFQLSHATYFFHQMNGYASTSGRFTVDASLGRDTTFGVYVDDEDDHLIRSVTFTDHRGQVALIYGFVSSTCFIQPSFLQTFGPYTSMSSAYDVINLKVINFPVGQEPPFDLVRYCKGQKSVGISFVSCSMYNNY